MNADTRLDLFPPAQGAPAARGAPERVGTSLAESNSKCLRSSAFICGWQSVGRTTLERQSGRPRPDFSPTIENAVTSVVVPLETDSRLHRVCGRVPYACPRLAGDDSYSVVALVISAILVNGAAVERRQRIPNADGGADCHNILFIGH